MSKHTIFVYDSDTVETVRLVMNYKPEAWNDVWLHVLRDRLKDETIQREEVPTILENMGEDTLDWTIVAVIPGDVESIDGGLSDDA